MVPAVCIFCDIVAGELTAVKVFEDDETLAFLDVRPVFPGHTLLVPKDHVETLGDLPDAVLPRFFSNARMLSRAVPRAMEAEGTFVAMNNVVSQSVPHLHVHVVPRRRKDGLRGFFWPRNPYESGEQVEAVAAALRAAVAAESA